MMVSRCLAWGGGQSVRALILLGIALFGPGVARAQVGGSSAALPPLPAVQDEVGGSADAGAAPAPTGENASTTAPVAAPTGTLPLPPPPLASPQEGAAPTAAPVAAAPSVAPAPSGRFASVADARDKLREAFAARNYSAVLGLAEEIRRQFPGETFMRYYEATARMQLKSGGADPTKLPYQHLDTLPSSHPAGAPTSATAKATPAATPALAAAHSTPAPTPRLTPAPTPAAVATATVPVAAPVTLKTRLTEWLDDLEDYKFYLLGAAGLLGILALAVVLVHRGKRAEEEDDDAEPDSLFGTPAGAPGQAAGAGNGKFAVEREYPLESGIAKPVFRSEVQAMAAAQPAFVRPEVELEIEDELEAELENERENGLEPKPEFNADQIFFHPAAAPDFTVEAGPEPEPELEQEPEPDFTMALEAAPGPEPLHELAPLQGENPPIEEPLTLESAGPAAPPQDLLVIDHLAYMEPETEPEAWGKPSTPAAPLDELSFKPNDKVLQPEFPVFSADQVAESLVIGEEEEAFEFPKDFAPQQPAPELVLPGFRFAGSGEEVPPANGLEPGEGSAAPLAPVEPEPAGTVDDAIAFAAEATQTAIPKLPVSEATCASTQPEETTQHPDEGAREEEPEFQAFRPGETVTIHMNGSDEDVDSAADQTIISPLPPEEEEKKTVDALDSSADVFEREYRQGLKDMESSNWVGAIHHLSIAAALRPGAYDVKDKLRESRRMRARELEGRA